ncbi:hypothetical protein [Actinoplanes sp. RD1]|uniref:hypothetical protein n=1 Tax=Actinoplanes sp. RD1 TaxID=3064538 RepID=UPI00274252F9|nr:hypothetical protein [Actinoplanes sp. RD1]
MLTETDDRILAAVNLHAVFGALPRLAELVPEARELLAGLAKPVTLTFKVAGGDSAVLVFRRDGITTGGPRQGTRAALRFRSPAHLNAVVAGKAQPFPLAGPAGLRFLTRVFTPLTDLLGRQLRPEGDEPGDVSRLLLLDVATSALVVIANEDRSGRFSAGQMADGDLDIAVGDRLRYRLRVADHRLARIPATDSPARAVFGFADLRTAGDVLAGRESALACAGDGRITMSGYIPLVDNTSRILDRVGHYLGK